MSKIFSQTRQISELTFSEILEMFNILSLEFLGTIWDDFTRDLEEKDVVVLLRKENGEGSIVGFSTLMVIDLPIVERKVKVIFSGDTTVVPEYRNSLGFGIGIGNYFMNVIETFSDYEIYYILISKGWRTYRCMPFLFKNYAPMYDKPTSNKDRQVIDTFGKIKFQNQYNSETGLIVYSKATQRLVPGSIDANIPQNPDLYTRFFLKKNPEYLLGTELVCVASVKRENFALPLTRIMGLTIKKEKV